MIAVIIAGGSGARLWPLSRETCPKQFLKIADAKTLIQRTVERILPLVPIEKCFVTANELHALQTCRQLSEYGFNPANLIAEPVGRNTAPAIGLSAAFLEKMGDEVMAVFSADHVIKDPQAFRQAVRSAEIAAEQGYLVTLGANPSRPETGYGYIRQGEWLDQDKKARKVDKFIEKPDLATAQDFFKTGGYLWNCGVFLWKISTLLAELKRHAPEIYAGVGSALPCLSQNKGKYNWHSMDKKGGEIFHNLPPASIDYALMEKSQNVAVVPVTMGWDDVGSWNALENIKEPDSDKNVFSDNVFAKHCTGTIIHAGGRLIAAVGLEDIVVADTPDALLVCKKDRAQDVKKIVEEIKKAGRKEAKTHAEVLKPWGSYTNLEKGARYLIKRIEVFPGEKLSLQSHQHRAEHWVVVAGRAEIQVEAKTFTLRENESAFIPKGARHRLANPGDVTLTLIETQVGDILDEADITRYEDLYGRA